MSKRMNQRKGAQPGYQQRTHCCLNATVLSFLYTFYPERQRGVSYSGIGSFHDRKSSNLARQSNLLGRSSHRELFIHPETVLPIMKISMQFFYSTTITFKYPYPNMAQILQEQYGLKPEEKIVVFWTKEISLPHFNRYRLRLRKVYSGRVDGWCDRNQSVGRQN